jgi:hypothetical protein
MKIKDLKLTEEDLHNLYDTLDIAMMSKFFNDTMKLNHMDKWLNDFFYRLDKVVIDDDIIKEKKGE